jgi:CMP-N,N'-diacetyllegionaminic acid synthase
MNIVGFIPARGGSKGIPNKNIYPVNGKPLIAYAIETALKSKIERTIVSTDSEEIAAIARKHGAVVPFLRPKELAQDDSPMNDALLYTINKLRDEEHYVPEIIVLLHPTTPLRTVKHINESVDLLISKKADTVVSVSPPMEHPAEMVYWDADGVMRNILEGTIVGGKTQRQGYTECYFLNGVIYTFLAENLRMFGGWRGKKIIPYLIRQIESIDIDSMDDLFIAESLIMRKDLRY